MSFKFCIVISANLGCGGSGCGGGIGRGFGGCSGRGCGRQSSSSDELSVLLPESKSFSPRLLWIYLTIFYFY